MGKSTVTIGIRDSLIEETVRKIAVVTGDENNLAVHAALVLFVVERLTGIEEIDKLREQLEDSTSRILDRFYAEEKTDD